MKAALDIAIPLSARQHNTPAKWLCQQVRHHCNPGDLLQGQWPGERDHIEWHHSSGHCHRQPLDRLTQADDWWRQLQLANPSTGPG